LSGVVLLPLVLLQAVSGLFLSFEWLLGFHQAAGEVLPEIPPLLHFWDWIAIGVHYGGGRLGGIFHAVIGIGLIWLSISGLWIYLNVRTRKKKT